MIKVHSSGLGGSKNSKLFRQNLRVMI